MAFSFALPKAGSNMLARIEMMVITTNSSMRVKPCRFVFTMFMESPLPQYSRRNASPPMKTTARLRRRPSFGLGLHFLDRVIQDEPLLLAHFRSVSRMLQRRQSLGELAGLDRGHAFIQISPHLRRGRLKGALQFGGVNLLVRAARRAPRHPPGEEHEPKQHSFHGQPFLKIWRTL